MFCDHNPLDEVHSMSDYNRVKEVNEAIRAGENALQSLYRAQQMLDKARTWGWIDILGGGLISGILKHSRMQEAKQYTEDARGTGSVRWTLVLRRP